MIHHKAGVVADVPPFCFLDAGQRPEAAARRAARALGLTKPADLIVLLWKLRAAGDGGGE